MNAPTLDFLIDKLRITEEFNFSDIENIKKDLNQAVIQSKNLNFAALENQRRQGSNTLKKKNELTEWATANNQILDWLHKNEELDFEHVKKLNLSLNPESYGQFRTQSIFAGLGEFIEVTSLTKFENLFSKNVLKKDIHPILKAAQVYQWISSFHPFENGNGRTARLAADFILMKDDYLPLSFENPFDAMVGIKSNTHHIDGNYGVRKLLKWLNNSYQIIYL